MSACLNCNTTLMPHAKFCHNCGAAAGEPTQNCPQCGSANPLSANFCGQCRHSFEMPEPGTINFKPYTIYELNFEDKIYLQKQLKTLFLKGLKNELKEVYNENGYPKYVDHFYASGFAQTFDQRNQILTAQLLEKNPETTDPILIEKIIDSVFAGLLDLYIIHYCKNLNKVHLPEVILKYVQITSFPEPLSQMVYDYLDIANENEKIYIQFMDIPPKVIHNAFRSFLFNREEEPIFLFCDQSSFGSGNIGFAFTNETLYWKAHFRTPSKIKLRDLREVKRESNWLMINDQYFYSGKGLNIKMFKLIQKLIHLNQI